MHYLLSLARIGDRELKLIFSYFLVLNILEVKRIYIYIYICPCLYIQAIGTTHIGIMQINCNAAKA